MEPTDPITALLQIHQNQMRQNEEHNEKVYAFHREQNETNKKTAEALQNLAHQIERSNDRHDINDTRIMDLEKFADYSKPIVDRSNWAQSFMSEFLRKYLLPALVIAILASAGYSLIPEKPTKQQEQSHGK